MSLSVLNVTKPTSLVVGTTDSWNITTTTGNMLVLAIMSDNPSYSLTSVTDNKGNTYTVVVGGSSATYGVTYFAYAFSVGAGIGTVALHSTGGTGGVTIAAYDISSATGGYANISGSGGGGASGPNPGAPSGVPVFAGLLIAVMADKSALTAVGSPFTLETMDVSALPSGWYAASAYAPTAYSSTSVTAQFTATSNPFFYGVANMIEKPAGSGQVGLFLVGF
jgi:hypothetical protein